jgi:hypothetical protein
MTQDRPLSLTELRPGIDGAALYRKRILTVDVAFPDQGGVVQTREGAVRYQAGDAIVTGTSGEQWSIARETFLKKYDPVSPTGSGLPGKYRTRANEVVAVQMTSPFDIPLSGERGVLHGDAGAWLVQYGPGDQAVVARDIFPKTYEPVDS